MFALMPVWVNWSPSFLKMLIYIFEPLVSGFIKNLETLNIKPETYLLNVLLNTVIYCFVICTVIFAAYTVMGVEFDMVFVFFVFFIILIFFMVYPGVIISQLRQAIDSELFYALRDLTVQVSAGISLYVAIKSIAKSDYGIVSEEFRKVVADIESGISLDSALKRMMQGTYSEYLRRALWQIIIVIKSGTPVVNVLEDILHSLKESQQRKLSQYLYEMNLWAMVYLIIAVTLPALIFVLSSVFIIFMGVDPFAFILFVIFLSAVAQTLMICYVKVRRPNVVQ
jgi:flagellar protein FlaJ